MKTHLLTPEPLTPEAFAPFGEVMEAKERPPDTRRFFPLDFRIEGRTTMDVIWQPLAEPRFHMLERHFAVTQTFIHLGGPPAVVAVGAPTDLTDESAIPPPDAMRAFLIQPGQGYVYRIGTWHSLDRYLFEPPGSRFLIVNVDPNPTQFVDARERFGVEFEIRPPDPEGVAAMERPPTDAD